MAPSNPPPATSSSPQIHSPSMPLTTSRSPSGATSSEQEQEQEQGKRLLPMPSRNPLPLSASQEAQVREVFNARVRNFCADEIQAFADCARNRTFTIPFACRTLSHAMNNCMSLHATAEEHDRAREEWFSNRMIRARERERKERRKLEQEKFHREWWGLPPKDPEDVQRDLEKLGRRERVGGFRSGADRGVGEEGGGKR